MKRDNHTREWASNKFVDDALSAEISMTKSQVKFLIGKFGTDSSPTMVAQTMFNRAVNGLMVETMTPQEPLRGAQVAKPPKGANPLLIESAGAQVDEDTSGGS